MGNNVGIAIFIFQALLALFAFFVTAPMTLNAISLFGVQKRFAQEMIKLGVVKEKDVSNMQPKKQIVGVLISLVVIGALCYSCYRTAPMGYLCGGVPLMAGFWKYRNILEMNNLTVQRVASRTNFDLSAHAKQSGQDLTYTDPFTNEKYVPYVIEPYVGVERMLLMLLCDAYDEETLENGDVRNILHLHPAIAPYKAAVLPLQKNKLGDKAREIYSMLSKKFMVDYDDSGAIGKRYRRHDEIGTPMCITVDFDTLEDNTVTVRDRDTMEQIRMPIDQLIAHIEQECDF